MFRRTITIESSAPTLPYGGSQHTRIVTPAKWIQRYAHVLMGTEEVLGNCNQRMLGSGEPQYSGAI